jgi:hypothetical protein
MAQQIQFRNGTAAQWVTANPILAMSELGLENDTSLYKIGNGVTTWNSLAYGGIQGIQGIPGNNGTNGSVGATGPAGATHEIMMAETLVQYTAE